MWIICEEFNETDSDETEQIFYIRCTREKRACNEMVRKLGLFTNFKNSCRLFLNTQIYQCEPADTKCVLLNWYEWGIRNWSVGMAIDGNMKTWGSNN
jgi:hypothetical protein